MALRSRPGCAATKPCSALRMPLLTSGVVGDLKRASTGAASSTTPASGFLPPTSMPSRCFMGDPRSNIPVLQRRLLVAPRDCALDEPSQIRLHLSQRWEMDIHHVPGPIVAHGDIPLQARVQPQVVECIYGGEVGR